MQEQKQQAPSRAPAIRLVAAIILTLLCAVLGALLRPMFSEAVIDLLGFVALGAIGLIVVMIVFNVIAVRLYKKNKEMSVRQAQQYYLERRDRAQADLPRAVRKIVFLRRAIGVYSALILLISMFIAFGMGIGGASYGLTIFPLYILAGYFNRVQIGEPKFKFEGYTNPADYPTLHALAHRAARALGKDGEIRIVLLSNCNAGIAKIGKTYSLQLGIMLLDVLSEEELYQILLHEFAHLTKDGNPTDREFRLFAYITDQPQNTGTSLLGILFSFFDVLYVYEYIFYRLTSSVSIEQIADSAILTHGDPKIASGALAKIAFSDLFDNEMSDFIEHYFAPEQMRQNQATLLCDSFRRAIKQRQDFWKELLMREIQPRNASHPIFRLRLQALGETDFDVILPPENGTYYEECQKAKIALDRENYEARKDAYEKERQEVYLAPLKIVEQWRAADRAVAAEEARPVIDALLALDFNEELEQLCDRIISETENQFATPHAHMTKGALLLRRYDKTGIDHIYRAIELNNNYVEDGLELIGNFCCRMGLQQELDDYRERAIELHQFQTDQYDKISVLQANDNLVPDTMPREMLDSILAYIHNVSDGQVSRVYLVRKIVSSTFFASVFVIRFRADADFDAQKAQGVMQKIFNHLDTRPEDWHFSLFVYDAQTATAVGKVADSCVYDCLTYTPKES